MNCGGFGRFWLMVPVVIGIVFLLLIAVGYGVFVWFFDVATPTFSCSFQCVVRHHIFCFGFPGITIIVIVIIPVNIDSVSLPVLVYLKQMILVQVFGK